jgi:hypothetical protein
VHGCYSCSLHQPDCCTARQSLGNAADGAGAASALAVQQQWSHLADGACMPDSTLELAGALTAWRTGTLLHWHRVLLHASLLLPPAQESTPLSMGWPLYRHSLIPPSTCRMFLADQPACGGKAAQQQVVPGSCWRPGLGSTPRHAPQPAAQQPALQQRLGSRNKWCMRPSQQAAAPLTSSSSYAAFKLLLSRPNARSGSAEQHTCTPFVLAGEAVWRDWSAEACRCASSAEAR